MYILRFVDISPFFLLNCFFIYSFMGWIFECIVISIENRKPVNRGFIRGPLCTVYGFGALSVYYFLQPVSDSFGALFICGAVFATIIELLTAKAMTKLFGDFWWDYSNKPFNYKGVICLESTVCWGLMSVATFVFIHPFVENVVSIYYQYCGKLIAVLALALYCIDFSTSFFKAHRVNTEENSYELSFYDFEYNDFEPNSFEYDSFDFEPQDETASTEVI